MVIIRYHYNANMQIHIIKSLFIFTMTLSLGWSFFLPRVTFSNYPTVMFAQTSTTTNEIFILSFDGVLAQTSRWRAHMGLSVALKTWPFLSTDERYSTLISSNDQEQSWIINKMMALSHVLRSDSDAMLGCDEVLLARMLLEEQALDQGQSDGSIGKYGSQYHPRKSYKRSNHRRGSRPLTVGEISANWVEGACLRDTIRIKYSVQRKDPIPIIRENIFNYLKETNAIFFIPKVSAVLTDVLSHGRTKVFILAGHSSHLSLVCNSLEKCSIPFSALESIQDIMKSSSLINVVGIEDDHTNIVKNIVKMYPNGSLFYTVHGSLTILKKIKLALLSDDSPIGNTNGFPCIMLDEVKDSRMKLCLPFFSESVSLKQSNEAEMDPWLTIVGEDDLAELLSARIISAREK